MLTEVGRVNRVTVAGIALVAAGVAAWVAFGPRARAPVRETAHEERTAEAPPVAPPGLARAPDGGAAAIPRGRSTIAGVVRRDGGPTAARVEVRFVEGPREAARTATNAILLRSLAVPKTGRVETLTVAAGADGRYRVDGLAAGVWRVAATADDGAAGEREASLGADGARVEADVEIGSGGESLAGRVVYADGRAFSGAVFVLAAEGWQAPWSSACGARVSLDAEGTFVARGLPRGNAVVTAIEDGVCRVVETVAVPHSGGYVLTVDAGATVREGRVVAADDGSPIPGATVVAGATSEQERFHLARTETDGQGRFRLALCIGRGGLRAFARGFVPLRTPLDSLPPGGEEIVMRLARGARLTGRVTTASDGMPVPGIAVRVIPEGGDFRFFPPDPATTDADGRYLVEDLPAGESVVLAEGAGWVTQGLVGGERRFSSPIAATLVASTTATFDIRVVKAASATGVVFDVAGRPVAGAVVRAEGRQGPNSYTSDGAMENTRVEPTATAADGTFSMADLVGGATYVFTATAPDGSKGHSGYLRARDEAPVRVVIRFVPERRIEVSLLAADTGAPVAGARVDAIPVEGMLVDGERASATTDEKGKATLVVRCVGDLRLDVSADGWKWPRREILVGPSDTSAVVRLERGFLVAGKVLMPDGSPAAGVEVYAENEEGDPGDPDHYGVRADEAGAFRMTFDTRGPRAIRARKVSGEKDLAAVAIAEAGGEPVTLSLAPSADVKPLPGSLVVRVVGPDGKTVPRARVRLDRGRFEKEQSGGRVEFRVRPGEESWVWVTDAEAADGTPLPFGPARAGPVKASADELVVRLPPESTVEGVVRGPDGKGVPGLLVTATWRLGDDDWASGSSEARTTADGSFRVGRVGEGPCSIEVDVPPDFVTPEPVASVGGARGVEVVLSKGVVVTVTVLDEEGKPVPRASVRAAPLGTRSWRAGAEETTDQEGEARLAGLDGSLVHRLRVDLWERRGAFLPWSREDWRPADTTVRLERGQNRNRAVSGWVRDTTGQPIEGALVCPCDDEQCFSPETTHADGTFTVEDLGAGDVTLEATVPGLLSGDEGGTRVQPGSRVVLVVDLGLELVVRIADWQPDAPAWANLWGLRGEATVQASARIAADGTARFRGLAPGGTYSLWVPPTKDGRSLLRTDVRASSSPLHVALLPGKSIRGRLTLPEGARPAGVTASLHDGHLTVSGTVEADGTYEIAGLPEGTWTVRARARKGDAALSAEAEVPAGGTADLVLR